MSHRIRRLHLSGLALALGLSLAAALLAPATQTAVAATCPPPPTPVHPFTPWNDDGEYVLTTGGSFEAGSPVWSLAGGATLVNDNAPNALDAPGHWRALYLPAGASATSPCVTAPHIQGIVRFFAKNGGDPSGILEVEILVKGKVYLAGMISAGSSWDATPILPSNAPAYKGAVAYQIRLTAVDAAFTADDVYFDPFRSG